MSTGSNTTSWPGGLQPVAPMSPLAAPRSFTYSFEGGNIPYTAHNSMYSVSSTSEHSGLAPVGCGLKSRTECQTFPIALVYCESCRRLFASDKDWHLRPGDYLGTWRAAGSRPATLCDDCFSKPTFEDKLAKETLDILDEIRAEKQRNDPKPKLFARPPKKRDEASERRARGRYAKWRIPLTQALLAAPMTLKEMNTLTKLSPLTNAAHYRKLLPDLFTLERSRSILGGGGKTPAKYGLKTALYAANVEQTEVLPPRDTVTHKFMKEVKPEPDAVDLNAALKSLERATITKMLEACDWNRKKAVAKLGLSYRNILYKIEALGITEEFTDEFIERKLEEFKHGA